MTNAQKLADALHAKLCHWNHDDYCGYFYEEWSNELPHFSTKREYLRKAEDILAILEFNTAMRVVEKL